MSKRNKKAYIGLYGNTKLFKAYCNDCQQHAIVVKGELQCCGSQIDVIAPAFYKRESEPEFQRRSPSNRDRRSQLEEQDHRCFYCERSFGSTVYRGARRVILQIAWDHMVPFDLTQDNNKLNFVAACQICNGIKSDKVFRTVEEAKVAVALVWESKGYKDFIE